MCDVSGDMSVVARVLPVLVMDVPALLREEVSDLKEDELPVLVLALPVCLSHWRRCLTLPTPVTEVSDTDGGVWPDGG